MLERAARVGEAFRRIVFAQVRISGLNTLLTAIYLTIILPLCGVHLPLTKTMIAVCFIAGLLPVIGNLISNTVIVIVSLSHSIYAALGSLAFLIVIHKLEYFVNARIVGTQIRARAWELLVAMLTMEAAFGIAGVVAAPIYYAYLKDELQSRGLIYGATHDLSPHRWRRLRAGPRLAGSQFVRQPERGSTPQRLFVGSFQRGGLCAHGPGCGGCRSGETPPRWRVTSARPASITAGKCRSSPP